MTGQVLAGAAVRASVAALNHVLRQQVWARDRLRAHVGRSICVVVKRPEGRAQATVLIDADALLQPAPEAHPAVTLTLQPHVDHLFALLREGPRGLAGGLKLEGDVLLAAAIGELAQHLRWDIEEDLSQWLGDPVAYGLGRVARRMAAQQADLHERVVSGMRAWCVEEADLLVERPALARMNANLMALTQRVARLELTKPETAHPSRASQGHRPRPGP
jgi:ubiquinone biosynthesis protein UbiJ